MNVPQLRFDGFDGEWNEFSFEQIASINMGQSPSGDSYNTSKQGEPLINGPTEFGEIYPTPVQWTTKPSKFSKLGDTLLCVRGSSIGRMNLSNSRYCIGRGVAAISGLDNKTTSAYMKYVLEKEVEKILKRSTGSTFPNISGHELKQSRISIPELKEQEKIAKFLTAIDRKREKQQDKIEKLEQFKKGMMQKIFSQELRFKDEEGVEFGEWEEKLIGEFLSESRIMGSKGDTALKLTVKLWKKGIIAKKEAIQGSVNTQYYTRRVGQLMYGKLDFLNCAFGIVPSEFDGYESTLDSPAFDIKDINSRFLLEYITRKEFYLKYGSQANGSRRAKRIHPDVFFDMPISVPSMEEQNKIGEFLDLLDKKVGKEKEKLMVLEEQKRGFMQGMFL